MSDIPPKETFVERMEDRVGLHTPPVAPAVPAPVAVTVVAPAPDPGHPWWVTSDPNHPVNRDPAEVAQAAAQKQMDEAVTAKEDARRLVENAEVSIETMKTTLADAVTRAEAAEARLAALLPPPAPVVDTASLAPGETLVEAGPGWVQTNTGRIIADLNGERARVAGLVQGEHPAAVDSASPLAAGSFPAGTPIVGVPYTPGAPRLETGHGTDLIVTWTPPLDDTAPAATAYNLRSRIGAGDPWVVVQGVTSPHALTGLPAATSVAVQVQAANTAGDSAWSGSSSLLTGAF